MNSSQAGKCCALEPPLLALVFPPILILEFVFGVMGNLLVLWTFVFHVDTWKPSAVYLTHLAVADSITLLCLPFGADYYRRGRLWLHGDAACRLLLFVLATNRAAGVVFLTTAALDRYFKMFLNCLNHMGLGSGLLVSMGLWGLVLLTTGYLFSNEHLNKNNCTLAESCNVCRSFDSLSTWHNIFYEVQFLMSIVIVGFCTVRLTWQLRLRTLDTRGKVRWAILIILAVAFVFFTCFLPCSISRIAVWILMMWYDECEHFKEAKLAFCTSGCFTHFNCVHMPVDKYFSSPVLSGTFQKVWRRLPWKKGDKDQQESFEKCRGAMMEEGFKSTKSLQAP